MKSYLKKLSIPSHSLQMDKFYLSLLTKFYLISFKKIYNPQAILLNASLALFLESFS